LAKECGRRQRADWSRRKDNERWAAEMEELFEREGQKLNTKPETPGQQSRLGADSSTDTWKIHKNP